MKRGFDVLTYWLTFELMKYYICIKITLKAAFRREDLPDYLEEIFFSYGSMAVTEALDNSYFNGHRKLALKFGKSIDDIVRTFAQIYC